ncbi:unnamed protein product [Amoebophrya sp. A120]|nr:unnamed protein product [Amoebophrya sp. A120]|eukprot:GSA120T00016151001.1
MVEKDAALRIRHSGTKDAAAENKDNKPTSESSDSTAAGAQIDASKDASTVDEAKKTDESGSKSTDGSTTSTGDAEVPEDEEDEKTKPDNEEPEDLIKYDTVGGLTQKSKINNDDTPGPKEPDKDPELDKIEDGNSRNLNEEEESALFFFLQAWKPKLKPGYSGANSVFATGGGNKSGSNEKPLEDKFEIAPERRLWVKEVVENGKKIEGRKAAGAVHQLFTTGTLGGKSKANAAEKVDNYKAKAKKSTTEQAELPKQGENNDGNNSTKNANASSGEKDGTDAPAGEKEDLVKSTGDKAYNFQRR